MPHKWWKVPRFNYLYHLCSIGIWRIKCQRSQVSEKSCEGVAIYINWLLNRDAIDHSQQAPAESTSLQFQSWTQHQHGGKRKLSCTSQWGWNNLGKLQVEIWWERWGNGTDQCLILTPCCHCAERKCQGLSQCDTVSFPCGKGEVPALKKPQYSCPNEVLDGEHDVTESDLMDIGYRMKFTS